MWPGFDSWTRRHMWVEFVVGSCPCSKRFFFGYSGFPLSSKPTFPNHMSPYCKAHLVISSWNYALYKFTFFKNLIVPLFIAQGYPVELLPVTVAGIPSMHICLDFICELVNQPQLEKQVCSLIVIFGACGQNPQL